MRKSILIFSAFFVLTILGSFSSWAQPVFTITNVKDACNATANGSFDITVTSGTGALTYSVISGPPFVSFFSQPITLGVPQTVSALPGTIAGKNYLIVVSDDDGPSNQNQLVFLFTAPSISSFSSIDNTSCVSANGSIGITVSGGSAPANLTFNWTGPGGPYSTEDLSNLSGGSYSVTVSDSRTVCQAIAGPIAIADPSPDAFIVSASDTDICDGESITINLSDSEVNPPDPAPGTTYQLLKNGNPLGASVAGTGAALVFNVAASELTPAGSPYTFSIVATNGVCAPANMTNTPVVTVNAIPVTSVITGDNSVCANDAGDVYSVVNTVGSTYAWTVPAGATITAGQGTNSITVTWGTTSGNVSVVETSAASCPGLPVDFAVTVNPLPNASVSAASPSICSGSSTNVNINFTGTAPWTFQVFDGTTTSAAQITSFGLSILVSPTTTTTYTVVNLIDANGCSVITSGSATVTVISPPSAALGVSAAISNLCTGGITDITVSGSQVGVSYQLRNDADDSIIGSLVAGTGGDIQLSTGILTATTTFNVLATVTGCPSVELTSKPVVTVSGTLNSSLSVTATATTLCEGGQTDIVINSAENGVLYQLRNDADNSLIGAAVAGTGANLTLPTGVLTSSITFNVLASNGSCSVELIAKPTVSVDNDPDINVSVNGPAGNICTGGTASVEIVNSEVGVSYQLRDDLNADALSGTAVVGTGGSIFLFSDALTASTTFNILASSGVCTPVELTTLVPVTISGTIDVSLIATPASTTVCENTATTIEIANPEAGVNYTLRNDADDSIIDGPLAGLTVIFNTGNLTTNTIFNILADNGACSAELTGQVTVQVVTNPDASLNLDPSIATVCSGGSTSVQVINSEVGVNYQLRIDPTNTLVGTAVAGTGGTILLPTDPLVADTDFNVEATNGICAPIVLTEIVSVTIGSGTLDNSLAVSASSSTICEGSATFIQVVNSEVGVSYQLRNDADDSNVNAVVIGDGATINLPTGNLTATTTFNVLAGSGTCSIELAQQQTITVNPIPSAALVVTSSVPSTCIGSSANITIVSSENGVLYELRNDADNSVVASATGDGSDLVLSTGALAITTTFNVFASLNTCSTELSTLVTITINSGPDNTRAVTAFPSQVCAGASSAIVVTSQNNIVYQLRNDADDSPIGGQFLGNGFSINLPTNDLSATTTFNVLASNMDGSCATELLSTVTVTTRALNDPLCGSGGGGDPLENCTLFTTIVTEVKPTCSGEDDGQLTFEITGGNPLPNYTIILIDTVIVSGVKVANTTGKTGAPSTPIVFTGLKPAQYYYRVVDADANICTLPYKLDRQVNIVAEVVEVSVPTCQGSPTGTARINIVSGGTSPYEYSIIGDFSDARPFISGELITDIPGNTAVILIRDDATDACPAEVTVDIQDGAIPPVVLVTALKQDASCNGNDGSIQINLSGGAGALTYKFGLEGNELDLTGLPADNTFTGLASGDYRLVVSDASGCGPYIFDKSVNNGFSVGFPGIVEYSILDINEPTCLGGGSDGRLRLVIENNNSLGNYEFAILTSPTAIPADADYTPASLNPVTVSDALSANTYYIWLRSLNADCPTIATVDIGGAIPITYEVTNINEQCFDDGGFIELSNITGVPFNDFQYQLKLDGETIDPGAFTYTESLGTVRTRELEPGNYEITLLQSSPYGCVTAPQSVTIIGPSAELAIQDPIIPSPDQETSFIDDPSAVRIFTVTGGAPVYFMSLINSIDEVIRPATEVLLVNTSYSLQYAGLAPGTFTAQVTDEFGCVAEKEFVVGVKTEIFIPNVFTPNNDPDNRNEVFFIRNLAPSGAQLVISNRWGNEVYSTKNYQNDWNAEGVSDGIYFYNLRSNGQEFTGWVEIIRGEKP